MAIFPDTRTGWISAPLAAFALACAGMTHAAPAGDTARTAVATDTSIGARVQFRTITIDGLKIFYREAGSPQAPTVILLHGFPASSFMYRNLIPQLAGRFHVVAPDFPGFGSSQVPPAREFAYTFEALTDVVEKLTERLGLQRYALYVQDIGGPVGFRLASRNPQKVSALVVQNANAYEQGLPDSFWAPVRNLWRHPTRANYEAIRKAAMSAETIEWNYTHGTRNIERIEPENWLLQQALFSSPARQDAMLALIYDYRTNLEQYPVWQRYFRDHQPPTLIVWGRNDLIFPEEAARAYAADLPQAELHLLDTGHFALEEEWPRIGGLMLDFLTRVSGPKAEGSEQ